MMPRINAVFTLADSGLNHVTLNAHATNVDTSIKMNCTTVLKDSVKECTLTTPAKDPASEAMKTEQNTLMKVPYQTLTTDPAKVSDYKINETRVLKQVAKVPVPTRQESSSKGVKHDNVVIPVVRELPNEGMVKELATQATKQLPQENIAHSNHANTTKDKGTEQLQINMPPLISTELARKAQSVGIPKLAPIHNREEPLTAIQKMSTDFDSYFANMAAKNIFANKTPTNDLANTTPKNDLAKITQKNDFANKKPKNELAEMTPKNDFANMTTRNDFANMTTRNDFANMTTKNDFANMTTRNDFANMTTRNDFANTSPNNDFANKTPKNDLVNIPPKNDLVNIPPKNDFKQSERNKVPPIVYTKNPQGPGFVGTLLESTDSMRQKEQVTSAKHADQTKDAVSQSTKNIAAPSLVNNQSNVLSDVQNKVCCNQENTDSPSRGIKRKASSVKSGETVDKKTKITKTTPSEGPPLKVKFSWTKRWTVEGGETYFRYERLPTPSQSTNVISKADNGKKVTFTDDPEIEFNFNSSEDIDGYEKINSSKGIVGFGGYEKNLLSISTKTMQTDAGRIPVHQIVYPTTVKVKLPEECIVVNNPKGYQFTYDYTKDKLISINHRIPQLKPIQKLGRDEAIRLGCSSSCPLLPAKEKPSKKQQKKHKKQKKPKFTPSYTPNLHNITKNPDFQHVPTGDKVAYLKELLRMQRAALGLSL
ncbi:uncharacterized protein [Amphiura filiformis]|uniref:uncharacterized protein n=1 Tax=Amphiura filiformis TaxID=82378 RepID=UPI003B224FD9